MIKQPEDMRLDTSELMAQVQWSPNISGRMNGAFHKAQVAVDNAAMNYTIKYTRMQTGALRRSTILHTVLGSGMIKQKTPYARRVYYGLTRVNLTKNPNARLRWFDVVIANHTDDIVADGQRALSREFGG